MFCKSRVSIWKLILGLLVLVFVMWALNRCSVNDYYVIQKVERAPVNEKCKVFRNWGVSNLEFMKWVHEMVDDTDWVEIRTMEGKRLDGVIAIITAVVYYKK